MPTDKNLRNQRWHFSHTLPDNKKITQEEGTIILFFYIYTHTYVYIVLFFSYSAAFLDIPVIEN